LTELQGTFSTFELLQKLTYSNHTLERTNLTSLFCSAGLSLPAYGVFYMNTCFATSWACRLLCERWQMEEGRKNVRELL